MIQAARLGVASRNCGRRAARAFDVINATLSRALLGNVRINNCDKVERRILRKFCNLTEHLCNKSLEKHLASNMAGNSGMPDKYKLKNALEEVKSLKKELNAKENEIRRLNAVVENRDSQIEWKDQQIEQLQAQVAPLQAQVQQLAQVQQDLAVARASTDRWRTAYNDKDNDFLDEQRDLLVANRRLADADRKMTAFKGALRLKMDEIEQMIDRQ